MPDEFEFINHEKIKSLKVFIVEMTQRISHIHGDLEICIILDGNVEVRSNKKVYNAKKDEILIFNTGQQHELTSKNAESLIISVQVSKSFCSEFFPQFKNIVWDQTHIIEGEKKERLKRIIVDLCMAYYKKEFGNELMCLHLLTELFLKLLRLIPYHLASDQEKKVFRDKKERIMKIVEYIDEHYYEKLLLSEIAQKEGLSLYYLSHLFKEVLDMTFQDYVNKVRLEKAELLLLKTNHKIIDICLESGFSDRKYLKKMIFNKYNCGINEFRENYGIDDLKKTHEKKKINIQRFILAEEGIDLLNKYK